MADVTNQELNTSEIEILKKNLKETTLLDDDESPSREALRAARCIYYINKGVVTYAGTPVDVTFNNECEDLVSFF